MNALAPPPPPPVESLVYTAEELAAKLGLNIRTIYTEAGRGKIPCRRMGRRLLFSRAVIDRWLEGK